MTKIGSAKKAKKHLKKDLNYFTYKNIFKNLTIDFFLTQNLLKNIFRK